MRIAQVAPIIERVPPKKYGGTERVVHALTEELVRRGHDVTLFASGDSLTSAKLVSVYPHGLREAKLKDIYGLNIWTLLNIGKAFEMQGEFDIIHDHNFYFSLPTAQISQIPVVLTIHGPFTAENRHIFKVLRKPHLVTVSKSQARVPGLNYAGTVYHGLDMGHYPFSAQDGGYLLFVGRIAMEKGVHYAIEAALNLDLPLIIAAKLEQVDRPYFREYVEPYLSEKIQWIGEVDEKQRNRLYSRARCFLHPTGWREPFGLTLIEAGACGCPVVAFGKGSIPEIITNGKNGFVVSSVEEMIDAIINIKNIDRIACRNYVLERFNAKNMANGYEEIYRKVLSVNRKLHFAEG
ncbi:MAG: glycosyltransferase family 4 protein [Patescibacteria group bacterium]|nr:glycosyltransferase family 4 protein [Patescibacteria group bacterium]